ncbi:MauE/DoxX family redox-associated membrane protein [Sphingobacterium sp. SRCM116780]|uniref:MauE/DoxX family redox-associated membrane protein n=1 Tax=Sphingobacterium sp. SRCM116780 TaxID=2907623 RepID=UPI00397EE8ED
MIATLIIYPIVTLFVLLWAYTSIPKFFKFKYFYEVLKSQAIPKWTVPILTGLLPILELSVVFMLLFPSTRLMGLYFSFGLMLIFTIYVSGIIYQVYDSYPCPCGAMFRRIGWKKHFKVNIWLTGIALLGILVIEFNLFK